MCVLQVIPEMRSTLLDGHYVSEGSFIAVTYYGQDRLFKVLELSTELSPNDSLSENLSDLSLTESKSLKEAAIFKISSTKTKLELQVEATPPDASGRGFEAIGGVAPAIQLLRELVLYPLQKPAIKGEEMANSIVDI